MNRLTGKIELLANTAIIVVAALMGVVLVKNYLLPRQVKSIPQIQAGARVSLADIDWTKTSQTLVVALQKGCHFCSESAPFYQRLAKEVTSRNNTQLVAVLPQPPAEGREYLNSLAVPINTVRQADLSSIQVAGTPTLILVNREGVVTDAWFGKLPPDKESEVLSKLQCETCNSETAPGP